MIELGQAYIESFTLSQEQVNQFASVSGDKNPIHIDEAYAATTSFKKPIVHGMFGASIISRVLGMNFPGEGTIYLKQDLGFKRPIYVDVAYDVVLKVTEVNKDKHTAKIETSILDKASQKVCLQGFAEVMNKEKI